MIQRFDEEVRGNPSLNWRWSIDRDSDLHDAAQYGGGL